jgi:hypothetical protein
MYAQHEHKGDYTCWVESTIDHFSQSAKIEIVGKVLFLIILKTIKPSFLSTCSWWSLVKCIEF